MEHFAMRITARVICAAVIDGQTLQPNTLIDIPETLATTLVIAGIADPHPSAVAYVRDELNAEPVTLRAENAVVDGEKPAKTSRAKKREATE